jgi:hypothetical protein
MSEDAVLPGFDIPLEYRQPRGHGSGQLSSQDENWFTHPEIIDLTKTLFDGEIDLDPMSCETANQVVGAKTFYTAEIDGLTQPWYGRILWNPPWGGTDANSAKKRGVKKLLDAFHRGDVSAAVCVLNANAMTTSWFEPLLAFPICIPPRRIQHWGPDGKGGSPNSGTVVVFVGVDARRFAEIFGRLGRILAPYDETCIGTRG